MMKRKDLPAVDDAALTRRDLIAGAVGTLGGAMLAGLPTALSSQQSAVARPVVPADATKLQGGATSPLGARSAFETPSRAPSGETTGSSYTPLQDLAGNITPSDLHFEIGRAHV